MKSIIRKRMEKGSVIDNQSFKAVFPKNMLLEVTNICNDSCLFCANSKSTRKRGFIEPKFAKKVLKEAYELGTTDVGFYATGEPLVNKELEEYIKYAKEIGYEYTYITTNGALLDKERANSLIEAGIDSIKFSINASNKKDYILIHGKDDFEKVERNLKNLSDLIKGTGIKLYISCIFTDQTKNTKDEFESIFKDYVDDIIFLHCVNQSGYMYEINNLLIDEKCAKYNPQNDICPIIFNNFYVTYEGYLTMCCSDFQNYLTVADLNQESLKEAWNNEYAEYLRKCHLQHDLIGTLCYNCIHNSNEEIKPLNPELAVSFDDKIWTKKEEIIERLELWNLQS